MRRSSMLFSREPSTKLSLNQAPVEELRVNGESKVNGGSHCVVNRGRSPTDPSHDPTSFEDASSEIGDESSERGLSGDLAKEDLQRRLFKAVSGDDLLSLKAVLADVENQDLDLETPQLREPNPGGRRRTVLHCAIEWKKFLVAVHLIATQKQAFLRSKYVNIPHQIPPSHKSALHSAAEAGNKDVIEKLLERLSSSSGGVDGQLGSSDTDFRSEQVVVCHGTLGRRRVSALHLVSINGHSHLIAPLLSFGFDVDCRDSEGETPLMVSVRAGHRDTARRLIESNAGVERAAADGSTPLHVAVTLGRGEDMVRLLLEAGNADVNAERIRNPKTPLESAADGGELKIVRALMRKGVHLGNRHGALMIAARKGHLDIVRCILQSDPERLLLDRPDDNGNTALMEAAAGNHLSTVNYLVGEGADLHWKNHARRTVFDIAMGATGNSLIQFLLENHHRQRQQQQRHLPTEAFYLHVAAANGDVEKIEYLLGGGFDFYAVDEHLNTFLHTAAFHNQPEVLEKFVTENDDVTALRNSAGETPIHIAARRGHLTCVEHLLKVSKLSVADGNGHTPLHAAIGSSISAPVVEVLVDAIRKANAAIWNDQDVLGRTPLHLAAAGKRPEVPMLLAHLDPEIEDAEGDTALHVAAEHGSAEVLGACLDAFFGPGKRGRIDHKDAEGLSALHRCARVADAAKVGRMLRHGADLASTDQSGKTVLHTMVDSYANNPTLSEKLVEVYETIVAHSTEWFCRRNDIKVPREDSREFYLTRLDAVLLLTSGMFSRGLNAIQYAAKRGANKLLLAILKTANVFRFDRNRPDSLKLKRLDELSEFVHMCKQHQNKSYLLMYLRQKDALFDVSYLVPGLMPTVRESNCARHPLSLNDDTDFSGRISHKFEAGDKVALLPKSKTSGKAKTEPKTEIERTERCLMSCLELIVNRDDQDSAVEVLTEVPFRCLVSSYWKLCRRTYEVLMWMHVIFMGCFTYSVMPTDAWLHHRFPVNSSSAENSPPGSPHHPPVLFGMFLLWPAFNLLFSLVNLLRAGAFIKGSMVRKLFKIGEITSGLLRIPFGIVLFIFDNLSQISSAAFGASYVAWYAMFICADNAHRYLECLALALTLGWLHTISFVKGFKDWNALTSILKQILLKDITRFIYIYIFILISFAYAIHVLIQADYHLDDPDYRSPTSTVYLTFYRMLSPGNVLDVSESEGYGRSGASVPVLRAVCSAYSILSSVVLVNLLIAMMNGTYSGVKAERSVTWRMDSLRTALWIERRFPLIRRLGLLRLKRTMRDSDQDRWYMSCKTEDTDSDSSAEEEELEEEHKELEKRARNSDVTELKSEVSRIREQLGVKNQQDEQLLHSVTDLRSELKLIHELCLGYYNSKRARVTRP